MIWLLFRPRLLVTLIAVGVAAALLLGVSITPIINDVLAALGLDWTLAL